MSFISSVTSSVSSFLAGDRTDLEKKLDQALSKENWGAPTSLLREISACTYDSMDYTVVMREVWASLNHAGKNWRQIFKGLVLLEYLVKFGAERVVDDARDHLFRIRTLTDFTYYGEGSDKGAGIREKAKQLVELLNDNGKVRSEREKAKQMKDKFTAVSNTGASGMSSGSYGSYTSSAPSRPHAEEPVSTGEEWSRGRGGGSTFEEESRQQPKSRTIDPSPVSDFADFNAGTTAQRGRGRRHTDRSHADEEFAKAFSSETRDVPASSKPAEVSFDDFQVKPAAPAKSFQVNIKSASALPATASRVAPAHVGLDAFHPTAAPQSGGLDDLFSASAPAPVPAHQQSAAFDPFAATPQKSTAPSVFGGAYDPFAAPAPPTNGAFMPSPGGTEFAAFTSAPPPAKPRDADVDKLFSFDLTGASSKPAVSMSTPGKGAPLNTLGSTKPVAAVPAGVMSGYASGAAGTISAMSPGVPTNPWPTGGFGPAGMPQSYSGGSYGFPAPMPVSAMPGMMPSSSGMPPGGYSYPAPGYPVPSQMGFQPQFGGAVRPGASATHDPLAGLFN